MIGNNLFRCLHHSFLPYKLITDPPTCTVYTSDLFPQPMAILPELKMTWDFLDRFGLVRLVKRTSCVLHALSKRDRFSMLLTISLSPTGLLSSCARMTTIQRATRSGPRVQMVDFLRTRGIVHHFQQDRKI